MCNFLEITFSNKLHLVVILFFHNLGTFCHQNEVYTLYNYSSKDFFINKLFRLDANTQFGPLNKK